MPDTGRIVGLYGSWPPTGPSCRVRRGPCPARSAAFAADRLEALKQFLLFCDQRDSCLILGLGFAGQAHLLRALELNQIMFYSTIQMSFVPEQALESWAIGDMATEPFHLLLLAIDGGLILLILRDPGYFFVEDFEEFLLAIVLGNAQAFEFFRRIVGDVRAV